MENIYYALLTGMETQNFLIKTMLTCYLQCGLRVIFLFQKSLKIHTFVKTKKLQPIAVQEILLHQGIFCFTPYEFKLLFRASREKTKYFLETYTHKGVFLRLKKGLYALKGHLPREEEIANRLYRPSYISFEYALAYYGIIPEMVYEITSATPKPTRLFTFQNKIFSYTTLKKKAFTGYQPIRLEGRVVLMAEPEKALIDTLYFVSLGKKSFNERFHLKKLDALKIRYFARLFGRPGLLKLIKKLPL